MILIACQLLLKGEGCSDCPDGFALAKVVAMMDRSGGAEVVSNGSDHGARSRGARQFAGFIHRRGVDYEIVFVLEDEIRGGVKKGSAGTGDKGFNESPGIVFDRFKIGANHRIAHGAVGIRKIESPGVDPQGPQIQE